MVDIDEKDILQANAAIIAGILILLTLLASVTDALKIATKVIMGLAISPFVFSIFVLLMTHIRRLEFSERRRIFWARLFTSIGLLYLIAAVIYLLIGIE